MKDLKQLLATNRKLSHKLQALEDESDDEDDNDEDQGFRCHQCLNQVKQVLIVFIEDLPNNIIKLGVYLLHIINDVLGCLLFSVKSTPLAIKFCCIKCCIKQRVCCIYLKELISLIRKNFKKILIVTLFLVYISIKFVAFAKFSICLFDPKWKYCDPRLIPKPINWEAFFTPELPYNGSPILRVGHFKANFQTEQLKSPVYQHKILQDETNRFVSVLDRVYSELNLIYKACSSVPNNFTGILNATLMLKKAGLTDLVQFYNTEDTYVWLQEPILTTPSQNDSVLTQTKALIPKTNFYKLRVPTKLKKSDYAAKILSLAKKSRNTSKQHGTEVSIGVNGGELGLTTKGTNEILQIVKVDKDKKKTFIRVNQFYWDLWNSNNMSLLNVSRESLGEDGSRIQLGGYWKPKYCLSNLRIAIIIPYRDRMPHLKILLFYLHLILQKQMHEYRIFVVEPNTPLHLSFNKGRVMNAAYLEALKMDYNIECFIFHDVDLVPEDDRTFYSCHSTFPRHLSVGVDKFNYILPYEHLVGGVFAITREHYRIINGYSNTYWGWGAEDDDLAVRLTANKLRINRPPQKYSRFKMMRHKPQKRNKKAASLLMKARGRFDQDGLNSVNYKVVNITLYTGFTHILVDVGEKERREVKKKKFQHF